MALDDENKRRSVTNFYPYVYPPIPDGNIDIFDRRQIGGFYRLIGFLSGEIRQFLIVIGRTKLYSAVSRVKDYVVCSRVKNYEVTARTKNYEAESREKEFTVVTGTKQSIIRV